MDQIDVIGSRILSIILTCAYWAALICAAGQVIKSLAEKDAKGAIKQVFVYGMAFGSIYMLRWLLDLIRSTFA